MYTYIHVFSLSLSLSLSLFLYPRDTHSFMLMIVCIHSCIPCLYICVACREPNLQSFLSSHIWQKQLLCKEAYIPNNLITIPWITQRKFDLLADFFMLCFFSTYTRVKTFEISWELHCSCSIKSARQSKYHHRLVLDTLSTYNWEVEKLVVCGWLAKICSTLIQTWK